MQEASTPPGRSRRDLVQELSLGMVTFGADVRNLTAQGNLTAHQTRRLLPAGLVAAIGGELLASTAYLAMGRWAYASAALVRQLVEVEYLAWAVTNDPDDAWEWLKSDKQKRLQRWQPGKIRQRSDGRFPNTDYHAHCEAGGHPVPERAMRILDHRDQWVELSLYEAAVHGTATWHYLLQAVGDAPVTVAESHHRAIDKAYEVWRRTETVNHGLQDQTEGQ
ncbi:hypothetical protein TUM20983_34890 [Mycobacterium antarcticum]|uniref:hypothetical protein n=1 Tax=Mycolicibacterium sp. TUM20983 TaxID=3023369 RepID=UPI00238CF9FA|nr:hypothetical protein [Mycolicibacterium sp. TUM20983]GLP76379.1 hypothetical protein TUM20983_34890 [Mycolicibacterium sp. TUM20983]